MILLLGGLQFAAYWNSGTFDGTIPAAPVLNANEDRRRRYAAATR